MIRATASNAQAAFTLIELMAAVLLTSIVVSIAVAFQINLGSVTEGARENLRTDRQAVALLDRMSRDIAGAYFIIPGEGPRKATHPWVFVTTRDFAEEDGKSDGLKFITRNYQPQDLDGHASDLAVVAYFLNPKEDAPGFEMLRWRHSHMPQTYDGSFPHPDNPLVDVVGDGIWSFGVSMIDRDGTEVPEWNSGRAGKRGGLPMAVRLEISMVDPSWLEEEYDPEFDQFEPEEEPEVFSKLIGLPLRALDWTFLEKEVQAAGAGKTGADGDEDTGDDENDQDDQDDQDDEEYEEDEEELDDDDNG
ncbi:MAG: prepilin-type N-terminal cleavage/methylation domain-containing protein [bacterium]|nr:prepilin-type N-terminal cleavage/methylation domain-containing protein [bacterium]